MEDEISELVFKGGNKGSFVIEEDFLHLFLGLMGGHLIYVRRSSNIDPYIHYKNMTSITLYWAYSALVCGGVGVLSMLCKTLYRRPWSLNSFTHDE